MNIVFISSECYPFTKVDSLGSLVSIIAKGIDKAGHKVSILMPRYGSIDPQNHLIEILPGEFKTRQPEHLSFSVYKGILPGSLVNVFFIDSKNHFSNSKEICLESESLELERFRFFSAAACEVISRLQLNPDVVHLFSPKVAPLAGLLKLKIPVAFALENIEGLSSQTLNETKAAIENSSLITTFSSSYASEYLSSNAIIRKKQFTEGILTGADDDVYNPEKDKDIIQTYSKNYFSIGKRKCKEEIINLSGFEKNLQTPLFSYVMDGSSENGLELFTGTIGEIARMNLFLVILGKVDGVSSKFKNIKVFTEPDEKLTKQIYGASDFIISTRKNDSSGMSILSAMKYGAVPVVYLSGAVKEIISEGNSAEPANGIVFKEFSKEGLLIALNTAIKLYKSKDKWTQIVKEAMSFNVDLNESTNKYINLYKKISKTQPVLGKGKGK